MSRILLFIFPIAMFAQKLTPEQVKFEVIKNVAFMDKDLDVMFKIIYSKPSETVKRYFEVIKTDNPLKNFFLADYLVIEKVDGKTKYYPLGWATNKIKEKDIRENCESIVKGETKAMLPE